MKWTMRVLLKLGEMLIRILWPLDATISKAFFVLLTVDLEQIVIDTGSMVVHFQKYNLGKELALVWTSVLVNCGPLHPNKYLFIKTVRMLDRSRSRHGRNSRSLVGV